MEIRERFLYVPLTSFFVLCSGALLSAGRIVALSRGHPEWRAAGYRPQQQPRTQTVPGKLHKLTVALIFMTQITLFSLFQLKVHQDTKVFLLYLCVKILENLKFYLDGFPGNFNKKKISNNIILQINVLQNFRLLTNLLQTFMEKCLNAYILRPLIF
jgi:hypothetical protein